VSRIHAVIERQGAQLVLVDQGSSNGTLVDGQPVPAENFRLVKTNSHDVRAAVQVRLQYACTEPAPLTLTLTIAPSAQSEIAFSNIALTNNDSIDRRLAIEGSFLGPLNLGENPADVYYLYPRVGACLHNRETSRRDRFGGRFPVQFMAAFNPVANSGVYLRTEAQREMRDYAFTKNGNGVSFSVHYLGEKGRRYWQAGLTVMATLLDEPYLSLDPRHQGLILHSVYHRPNGWDHIPPGRKVPCDESSMWGDYHAREAALYLSRQLEGRPYLAFFGPTS